MLLRGDSLQNILWWERRQGVYEIGWRLFIMAQNFVGSPSRQGYSGQYSFRTDYGMWGIDRSEFVRPTTLTWIPCETSRVHALAKNNSWVTQ